MFLSSADHQTKDRPQPVRQRIQGLWQKQVRYHHNIMFTTSYSILYAAPHKSV